MIPAPDSQAPPRRPSLVETTSAQLAEHVVAEYASRDVSKGGAVWLPSERELAVRFGVSRPVIREATKRLELQGLLEIHHGRGTKVVHQLQKPLTQTLQFEVPDELERLRQLNETRQILEPESARLAALRATPESLKALRKCQRDLERCQIIEDAAKIDARFHELIARAAGNGIVALILSSFGDLAEESRRRTMTVSGLATAVSHHAAILTAINARDPEKAAQLMREHVEEASHDLEDSESPVNQ